MEVNMINKVPSRHTPVFHVSQNDANRSIGLELYDGMERDVLPADASIRVRYRKQDGSISSFSITTGYTTDTLYPRVPDDVCTVPGHVYCKLIVDGIGYKAFFIEVEGR